LVNRKDKDNKIFKRVWEVKKVKPEETGVVKVERRREKIREIREIRRKRNEIKEEEMKKEKQWN